MKASGKMRRKMLENRIVNEWDHKQHQKFNVQQPTWHHQIASTATVRHQKPASQREWPRLWCREIRRALWIETKINSNWKRVGVQGWPTNSETPTWNGRLRRHDTFSEGVKKRREFQFEENSVSIGSIKVMNGVSLTRTTNKLPNDNVVPIETIHVATW